jgi:hypothetical protein
LIVVIILIIYINLSNWTEVERAKAAVRRDCQADLDIAIDDIREPGVIIKDDVVNGTPVRVLCQSGYEWSCTCEEANQLAPTSAVEPTSSS